LTTIFIDYPYHSQCTGVKSWRYRNFSVKFVERRETISGPHSDVLGYATSPLHAHQYELWSS